MDSGTVTGAQLMERAGQGVVEAFLAEWPELAQHPGHAVVLCGPGNNGGDGFVVARLLHDRGWQVEVFLAGHAGVLPADAARNHRIWTLLGPVRDLTAAAAAEGARPDVVIDALFGLGLSRPVDLGLCAAFHAVRDRPRAAGGGRGRALVVAVDCPSGIAGDTGELLLPPPPEAEALLSGWWAREGQPRLLPAHLTVTFHAPKICHYSEAGSGMALRVVDIGLRPEPADAGWFAARPLDPARIRLVAPEAGSGKRGTAMWLRSIRPDAGHKFDRGHVLVCGGGPGQGGAARLAARGALRIGAGLVTIATPPEALAENAARLDAIMLRPVAAGGELAALLRDPRITAVCLGPGLGLARARDLVPVVLAAGRRTVLDADALSAFADAPDTLFALLHGAAPPDDAPGSGVILTPHEGEFARLFPDLAGPGRRGRSKVDAVRTAAARAGATVLLKGAATVIARPDGLASVHPALYARAAPHLATAGAGDVLAGFIAGLIASPQLSEVHRAVELAAWLHVECARSFGPGLIAEDLPEELPKVLRALGL